MRKAIRTPISIAPQGTSIIGLVNGYVDIGTWYGITPFVGAGVGVAQNRLSGLTDTGFTYSPSVFTNGGAPTGGYFSNGSKTNFAWALMTGLDFNVTENLKLELGYRYLNYGKFASGGSNCFNGTGANGGFSPANCGGSANFLSTGNLVLAGLSHRPALDLPRSAQLRAGARTAAGAQILRSQPSRKLELAAPDSNPAPRCVWRAWRLRDGGFAPPDGAAPRAIAFADRSDLSRSSTPSHVRTVSFRTARGEGCFGA